MKLNSATRISVALATSALFAVSMVAVTGMSASADQPTPPIAAAFAAPRCAGTTDFEPTANTGYAVLDLTQVFGQRLTSYNAGATVPLYDSFGSSILLDNTGTDTNQAAYPPVCETRYVASVGGPVSEWMFCTDLASQSCGDTDAAGNIVDHAGDPINPMTDLTVNSKLTPQQVMLIAYLMQVGHAYAGVGNQAWGGVTEARSDLGTNERDALQTLIWCISDPPTDASDFHTTCDNNMDTVEQQRLLAMIPEAPALTLKLTPTGATLNVGDTANVGVTTNVFNQPISLATGGTATTTWAVCSGPATLTGSTLTVAGTDPTASENVVLCGTATTAGTATVSVSAAPPSTQNIGWAQSVNTQLTQPCQVYTTALDASTLTISASAQAVFGPTSGAGATSPSDPRTLGETGGPDLSLLWLWLSIGLGLIGVGGAMLARTMRRTRLHP